MLPGLAALSAASALPVGSGSVKLGVTVTPEAALAGLKYEHRFSESGFAFGDAWGGAANTPTGWKPDFGVSAGVGFRW